MFYGIEKAGKEKRKTKEKAHYFLELNIFNSLVCSKVVIILIITFFVSVKPNEVISLTR